MPQSQVMELADRIESVLPKRRPILHHEPFIDKRKAFVDIVDCMASGIQNYKKVDQFEGWLKEFTKSEHVLATSSGTAALHLALLAAGVKSGDEVIVPATTFVATANAVSHAGAVPHFIDGAPNIDPNHLKEYLKGKQKVTAIIVVHLFGIPADMPKICEIAKENGLIVIEDASQALGSYINNQHVGTFGTVGTFSFNNNKILTTNGGGALITNDPDIRKRAYQLSIMGRIPHKYFIEHECMGWNYRMSSLNASLGLHQAVKLRRTLALKYELAQKYRKSIESMAEFVESGLFFTQNHWLNVILVENRDELLEELHLRRILARASFTPLNRMNFYQPSNNDCLYINNVREAVTPVADEFFRKAVCLPSGDGL